MEGELQKEANGWSSSSPRSARPDAPTRAWRSLRGGTVYGGYGYCADYPVEKYKRDSKILPYGKAQRHPVHGPHHASILMHPAQFNYTLEEGA